MRCYDYVTVPYDRVRGLLHSDAAGIFARATATANDRVRELMATLRLNVGPVEVGVDVQLKIGAITDEATAVGDPRTRLDFTWQAAKSASFFPTMEATLSAYPLSPGRRSSICRGATGLRSAPWERPSTPPWATGSPRPRCSGCSATSARRSSPSSARDRESP